MRQMAQFSVVLMLVDFLFGISAGIVLSASWAALREDHCRSLLGVAPDAVCAGVRVLLGLYTSDDGYLQHLLSGVGTAPWGHGRPDLPGWYGRRAGR
jgi:hypothetical protein